MKLLHPWEMSFILGKFLFRLWKIPSILGKFLFRLWKIPSVLGKCLPFLGNTFFRLWKFHRLGFISIYIWFILSIYHHEIKVDSMMIDRLYVFLITLIRLRLLLKIGTIFQTDRQIQVVHKWL